MCPPPGKAGSVGGPSCCRLGGECDLYPPVNAEGVTFTGGIPPTVGVALESVDSRGTYRWHRQHRPKTPRCCAPRPPHAISAHHGPPFSARYAGRPTELPYGVSVSAPSSVANPSTPGWRSSGRPEILRSSNALRACLTPLWFSSDAESSSRFAACANSVRTRSCSSNFCNRTVRRGSLSASARSSLTGSGAVSARIGAG